LYDGQTWHHLKEGSEEVVPDVVFHEEDTGNQAAPKDSAVLKKMEGNERDRCELPFPYDKSNDCRKADDEHGNHESRRPLLVQSSSLVGEQVEGQ
jgi:hypothetical protein